MATSLTVNEGSSFASSSCGEASTDDCGGGGGGGGGGEFRERGRRLRAQGCGGGGGGGGKAFSCGLVLMARAAAGSPARLLLASRCTARSAENSGSSTNWKHEAGVSAELGRPMHTVVEHAPLRRSCGQLCCRRASKPVRDAGLRRLQRKSYETQARGHSPFPDPRIAAVVQAAVAAALAVAVIATAAAAVTAATAAATAGAEASTQVVHVILRNLLLLQSARFVRDEGHAIGDALEHTLGAGCAEQRANDLLGEGDGVARVTRHNDIRPRGSCNTGSTEAENEANLRRQQVQPSGHILFAPSALALASIAAAALGARAAAAAAAAPAVTALAAAALAAVASAAPASSSPAAAARGGGGCRRGSEGGSGSAESWAKISGRAHCSGSGGDNCSGCRVGGNGSRSAGMTARGGGVPCVIAIVQKLHLTPVIPALLGDGWSGRSG
eukprot:scaffold49019_cov63-Phaeocystis_antarctica.AAC.6